MHVFQIFDKFIPCLKDSNAKVNLYALQVMLDVTPILSDSMGSVINLTTQTVASNLSSKNREIHQTATEVLDAFMDNIGKYIQKYMCDFLCVVIKVMHSVSLSYFRGKCSIATVCSTSSVV